MSRGLLLAVFAALVCCSLAAPLDKLFGQLLQKRQETQTTDGEGEQHTDENHLECNHVEKLFDATEDEFDRMFVVMGMCDNWLMNKQQNRLPSKEVLWGLYHTMKFGGDLGHVKAGFLKADVLRDACYKLFEGFRDCKNTPAILDDLKELKQQAMKDVGKAEDNAENPDDGADAQPQGGAGGNPDNTDTTQQKARKLASILSKYINN